MVMKRFWLVVMCVVLVACANTSHPTARTGAPPTGGRGSGVTGVAAQTTFVSYRYGSNGHELIDVSDARNGAVVKTLLVVPRNPSADMTGTAIATDGQVWVTLNTGPACTSEVLGCGPKPHTCSSKVIAINPRTGTERTVLTGGDNELISDVQPSPAGDHIAYLYSGCATFWFNDSLRVRNLHGTNVVNVGQGLARCHFLSQPRWSIDGTHLVVLYGQPTGTAYPVASESCSQPKPSTLVVVSAEHSQTGVTGTAAPLDTGCQVNAVAVTQDGYAGVEQCGVNDYLNGPVRLVRYNDHLIPTSRVPLGNCEDGASLAGNAYTTDAVVSTYQFCNPPGTPGPVTKVFLVAGNHAREVLAIPGGNTAVDHIAY